MKKRYWLLLLLAVILAILWWYHRDPRVEVAQREDPSMLFNRVWVDSTPDKDTDYLHAMIMLTRLPIGAFQRASQYRMVSDRNTDLLTQLSEAQDEITALNLSNNCL